MSDKKAKAARREQRSRILESEPNEFRSRRSPRIKSALPLLLVAISIAAIGFGIYAYWNSRHPPGPLHAFSAKERTTFIDTLKGSGAPTQSVWLACPEGKDETCRLMRQFIPMFQESGWRVEGNRVITWKPAHPLGGVHLILRVTGGPDDSTPAESRGIKNSFSSLGIPVQTAAAPDVPANSIGVYFGPDL